MKKNEIRMRVRARKSLLDDSERRNASIKVFSMLERMAAFMMADRVLPIALCRMSFPLVNFLTNGTDTNAYTFRVSMVWILTYCPMTGLECILVPSI